MTYTGSTNQFHDTDWPRNVVYVRTKAEQLVLDSYENTSISLEEYAKIVIAYAESQREVSRRAATARRIQFLRDQWGPLLKSALKNWLTVEARKLIMGENMDNIDLSRNPAKTIWNELSVLYKTPPVRQTPEDPNDVILYNKLLLDTGFDLFWKLVELLLNACNEIIIWPEVITKNENGKEVKVIKHRYATGATMVAIPNPDDMSEIETYVEIVTGVDLVGRIRKKYRIWSKKWHAEFEVKDDEIIRTGYVDPKMYPDKDDSAKNPYGMTPMVRLRLKNWQDVTWDITSGEDLTDLTLHQGKDRAIYRYLQKVAGFKQGVVTGSPDDIPQQILDPGYLLEIPGDNLNFHLVDWQLKLLDRLECMDRDELAAAANHGINPQRYKKTGDYQSTSQAKTAERGLHESREDRKPIFCKAEADYKKILCVVADAHGIENLPDPDIRLEVTHAPIAYPEDPMCQTNLDKEKIALGVQSQVDVVKREHPNWTDDQALEYIDRCMELIAKISEKKIKHNVPDDPTKESKSAELNGAMGPVVRDNENPEGSNGSSIKKFDREY